MVARLSGRKNSYRGVYDHAQEDSAMRQRADPILPARRLCDRRQACRNRWCPASSRLQNLKRERCCFGQTSATPFGFKTGRNASMVTAATEEEVAVFLKYLRSLRFVSTLAQILASYLPRAAAEAGMASERRNNLQTSY